MCFKGAGISHAIANNGERAVERNTYVWIQKLKTKVCWFYCDGVDKDGEGGRGSLQRQLLSLSHICARSTLEKMMSLDSHVSRSIRGNLRWSIIKNWYFYARAKKKRTQKCVEKIWNESKMRICHDAGGCRFLETIETMAEQKINESKISCDSMRVLQLSLRQWYSACARQFHSGQNHHDLQISRRISSTFEHTRAGRFTTWRKYIIHFKSVSYMGL